MKNKISSIAALILTTSWAAFSQGFVNLNFESANVSGYSQTQSIPVADALPGWSASFKNSGGTYPQTEITYDGISTGSSVISIVDSNIEINGAMAPGFYPIQGSYMTYLFAGSGISAIISQTGVVPAGTESLLFDARASTPTFVVTLGGQTVTAIPLQTFPNYTLYGCDVSAFAGQLETLSFVEPPAPRGQPGGDPNIFGLDDIQFSPTSIVPEPTIFGLTVSGGLVLARIRWRKRA